MPSHALQRTHRLLKHLTLWSAAAFLGVFVYVAIGGQSNGNFHAYLSQKKKDTGWKAFTEAQVMSGATIPGNMNVVFHVPFNLASIDREVLLGHKGEITRYWGYCFPANYDPSIVSRRAGLPGLLFLSEKERAKRKAAEQAKQVPFSLVNLPSKEQIDRLNERNVGAIRHQLERFEGGMLCYIMSAESLAIGIDPDNDRLNNALETEIGTAIDNPDTDSDGVTDGVEFLNRTNPLVRDSDSDGIIDGIEDTNWNGRVDIGETDPRTWDTDRDGLCDGMCRIKLSNNQQVFAGEDKNLNGVLDQGETDPRRRSTLDNGVSDQVPYLKCLLEGKTTC